MCCSAASLLWLSLFFFAPALVRCWPRCPQLTATLCALVRPVCSATNVLKSDDYIFRSSPNPVRKIPTLIGRSSGETNGSTYTQTTNNKHNICICLCGSFLNINDISAFLANTPSNIHSREGGGHRQRGGAIGAVLPCICLRGLVAPPAGVPFSLHLCVCVCVCVSSIRFGEPVLFPGVSRLKRM